MEDRNKEPVGPLHVTPNTQTHQIPHRNMSSDTSTMRVGFHQSHITQASAAVSTRPGPPSRPGWAQRHPRPAEGWLPE